MQYSKPPCRLGADEIRLAMADKPKREFPTWKITWKKIEGFYDGILARVERAVIEDNSRWVGYVVVAMAILFIASQVIRYFIS